MFWALTVTLSYTFNANFNLFLTGLVKKKIGLFAVRHFFYYKKCTGRRSFLQKRLLKPIFDKSLTNSHFNVNIYSFLFL